MPFSKSDLPYVRERSGAQSGLDPGPGPDNPQALCGLEVKNGPARSKEQGRSRSRYRTGWETKSSSTRWRGRAPFGATVPWPCTRAPSPTKSRIRGIPRERSKSPESLAMVAWCALAGSGASPTGLGSPATVRPDRGGGFHSIPRSWRPQKTSIPPASGRARNTSSKYKRSSGGPHQKCQLRLCACASERFGD
jgi:hypothetical protein